MANQWEIAYEGFSWWKKMKYEEGPDYSEFDDAIKRLTKLQDGMNAKHESDFAQLYLHFEQLERQAFRRMTVAKKNADLFVQNGQYPDDFEAPMLEAALWFSALSVPVSIWADIASAMDVYEALRSVNGKFAGMSNTDIWWESLLMSEESFVGLAALAKGVYFERLVAADSGGELHAHFNHPDTDIIIDGVGHQIKATDSDAYIYSVDESIPVITTSEVAASTGAIDGGYSEEELSSNVDLALGGTVVDMGDTGVDAILAGLGGLGFIPSLKGIHHASVKHQNGGDGVEAMFEGAGVAIEGTAEALVNVLEMSYNFSNSRPVRAVVRGLKKLDI